MASPFSPFGGPILSRARPLARITKTRSCSRSPVDDISFRKSRPASGATISPKERATCKLPALDLFAGPQCQSIEAGRKCLPECNVQEPGLRLTLSPGATLPSHSEREIRQVVPCKVGNWHGAVRKTRVIFPVAVRVRRHSFRKHSSSIAATPDAIAARPPEARR